MNAVFDIDGTLSFDGQVIAKTIVDALHALENQGYQVIFASARPIRDLLPIIPEFQQDHLLIGGNGAIVQRPDNQVVATHLIDSAAFITIKTLIAQYHLNYIIDDRWNYAARVPASNLIYRQLDPAQLAQQVSIDELTQPIKIILVDIPQEDFQDVLTQLATLKQLNLVIHSGEHSIDITSQGINKYTTLMKYQSQPYIAFGNDHNDQELLQHAQMSVWVGGVNERLKQLNFEPNQVVAADVDAIARAIQDLIS
ncbi:Cof subfamily protein (haloacid dehalogenase superfamily) [Weissella uvarum]|uniref:HAD-IIB family hydrolase n=1 Tax=Weissella uvarum TaxID=1479233 RepID=UPI00195F6F31|nr:HAD family hydrolase [Weissella uvarum]MBM7617331.1 Cof subfamily protein (haloacid dehalogenase superfamily) [Weissella uvarum]MCM0595777.1 HAD family phosphatase [Weissella uvarum]